MSDRVPSAVDRRPLLSVHGLVKAFGNVRAVDGVSIDFYPREVVGIIGDNGAGKSTFLGLLAGFHQPDAGQFIYRGEEVTITSPRTSRNRLRIEMVYQNLELAPDLTTFGESLSWPGDDGPGALCGPAQNVATG